MWKALVEQVDLGEPTSFLDIFYFGLYSTRIRNEQKILWTITETCLNLGSPQEQQKSYPVQEDLTQISQHGPVIWKVMQRNVCGDIAIWQIKQLRKFSKSQRHAWMIINSKKKNWDLLENCQKFAF